LASITIIQKKNGKSLDDFYNYYVAILLNIFGVIVAVAGGIAGGFIRAIIETS
jgi:hypothetical protein